MIHPVATPDAPPPNGHYSQAVRAGDWLYLSLQLPTAPESGAMPSLVEDQASQVIDNCRAVLVAGGAGLHQVVSASFVVTDIAHWPVVDQVWADAMGPHRPARGVVVVKALHRGASVGLQLVAYAPLTAARHA